MPNAETAVFLDESVEMSVEVIWDGGTGTSNSLAVVVRQEEDGMESNQIPKNTPKMMPQALPAPISSGVGMPWPPEMVMKSARIPAVKP